MKLSKKDKKLFMDEFNGISFKKNINEINNNNIAS